MSFKILKGLIIEVIAMIFFNTLFGSLNHFGQNVLHLVPKQKREEKRRRKLYK